ncbi:hypothetical protein BKA66DRAFT_502633 [Pyrenochaeta sp. MPI-SDFR-AT-0127]|nr:hypothetical protein BKA66DRAFT_502633 [Pyrenochaeta sp. MPI-SDFR-AT-0127]
MAVILPSKSSKPHVFISNIISRFRSKNSKGSKTYESHMPQEIQQDARPPLIPAPLPLVLPEHQLSLSSLGWTTVTFPQSTSQSQDPADSNPESSHQVLGHHPLQIAYEALFAASQAFFDQSDEEKQVWKHKLGSEEGWSKIPGEKEFITLRTLEYCPEVLREPAKRYWDLMGAHLSSTLGRISTSLALPAGEDEGLQQFVGPCATFQASDDLKTATMLRLFRYEGWEAKVVAEPHADLGLLSIVVGNVPGLEVWDGQTWFEVEREVERSGQKGASMLVGRQLERLSNGRYAAGGHRVVSYGSHKPPIAPAVEEKAYRFSIVLVLRAHEPVIINSDELVTDITGKWADPIKGVTAGKFYEEIRGRHFNINIDVSEREKQRRRVRQVKGKDGEGFS